MEGYAYYAFGVLLVAVGVLLAVCDDCMELDLAAL